MSARILIVDDHVDVQEALRILLKGDGHLVDLAGSPESALAALRQHRSDLLLMDLNFRSDTTSGREGMDLLTQTLALDPLLPVVVMTGFGSIELAVEAMRRGARDFVQKPWDNTRLLATVRTQLELRSALRRNQRLEAENALLRGDAVPTLVAESPAMRAFMDLLHKVAPSDANVLITGENGTGKSLVARVLHASSGRSAQPFLTLNAGGLAEGVLESELFGHVKGAFTDAKAARAGRFELADGGTLFLDEIANAPFSLQARLLRVLETGEFERVGSSTTLTTDVRLLAATNADLAAEVQAGRFRQDLRFRINTIELHLPPLRDRREDVGPLASRFLARHAQRYRKPVPQLDEAALHVLERHGWPGNVRELDHAMERAVLLGSGDRIRGSDLMLGGGSAPSDPSDLSLEEMERRLVRRALARFGTAVAAAEALGLSRSAMYRRLQKLGISE